MKSKDTLIKEIEEVCITDMDFFCNQPINGLELAMKSLNIKLNSLTKVEVEAIHGKAAKSPYYHLTQDTTLEFTEPIIKGQYQL